MSQRSLDASYFERIYAAAEDPWNFSSSDYEAQKYAATLELLGEKRFTRALEIGCSIGVFSNLLAQTCDAVVAIDVNARALERARERCAHRSNIRFELRSAPNDFPAGPFDLIVLSEVGYYWSDEDLSLARECIAREGAGGTLALVHYLPHVDDYVRDGDVVHDTFLDDPNFTPRRARREELYRIDVVAVRS